MEIQDIEEIELNNIVDALYRVFGYDFRSYGRAHLMRRLMHRKHLDGCSSLTGVLEKLLYQSGYVEILLKDLSINVTEMYRDPSFYQAILKEVIPVLKTYPFLRIWHAGCSTGEEVYSMAIFLKEAGLLSRSLIYATDFNQNVLDIARLGIYPKDKIKEFSSNYRKSGGLFSLSRYYTSDDQSVIMNAALKENVVFADHNLVTDGVFGEMHLIVCRNVMIYFDKSLQEKVVKLFHNSLLVGGFLALGSKESLQFSGMSSRFIGVDASEKIYQRKYE